jgi:hypothetical protein
VFGEAPRVLGDLGPTARRGETARRLRVYQVAPKYEHVAALLGEGLDSAQSVSSLSEDAFVRKFEAPLGGSDTARVVHRNARQVVATATNLFTMVHQAVNDVVPMAMGGPAISTALTKQVPDWATLFGRLDLCECRHCRSVYSPAAYLVDLLQFLNPTALPPGVTQRPLDVLRQRRPDLENIQLVREHQ